jgi:hypothetical protein
MDTMRTKYGGLSLTARKSYRRRIKSSKCRGKLGVNCRKSMGCKKVRRRTKSSYCRKMTNTRRHKRPM